MICITYGMSDNSIVNKKMTRREALSTTAKIAIATGVAAIAAGGGVATYFSLQPPAPTRQEIMISSWRMVQSAKNVLYAQQAANTLFEKEMRDKRNINVKIETKVFEYPVYRTSLLTAVQAGNPPTVSTIDQIWSAEFATAGYIEPLDDLIASSPEIKKDDFFEGAWNSNVVNGKTYGIPFDVDVWEELYYNKDMFEKAGLDPNRPPETWDELLEFGKILTDPSKGQWGLGLIAGKGEFSTCIFDSFIFTNGGDVVD
ncbi:sn-glycerol-3-phosphate-binding periplasmic protein UgpB [archaeon HR06]|nr:sn-glycerol-3-phosphate-binding periplasmic protein UgpB [archaeon HR06]